MHSTRGKRQLGAGGAGAREWAHALADDRIADTVCGAADGTREGQSHGRRDGEAAARRQVWGCRAERVALQGSQWWVKLYLCI